MSTVENVFQAIDSAESTTYELFYPRYLELLAAIADGKQTDPEEARHVFQAMGKARHEIDADLQLFVKRRRALEALEATPESELQAERADLESSIEKIEDKRKRAEEKYKAERAELQAKLDEVSRRSGARISMVHLLRNHPLNKALTDEFKKLNSELLDLSDRRRQRTRFRMETERLIASIKSEHDGDLPPLVAKTVEEQERILAVQDSKLEEIDQASRAVQFRLNELNERLLSEI